MSTLKGIFEPFKSYVQDQLNLRKRILRNKNIGFNALPQEYFTWTSKQAIIRMASGVDVRGDSENPSPVLDQTSEFEKSLHGAELAKNWILEGGINDMNKLSEVELDEDDQPPPQSADQGAEEYTYQGKVFATGFKSTGISSNVNILDETLWKKAVQGEIQWMTKSIMDDIVVGFKTETEVSMRAGIGTSGAYGDPKVRADRDSIDNYGIVPMPGITDAQIRTKSDDGSLREAQVNFICHNRRQLEILEMLYMRPGYPILLEWGWNPYITSTAGGGAGTRESFTTNIPIVDEFFKSTADLTRINLEINRRKEAASGNYDGFVGYVKNFSFKSTPMGGFECTTEIIAQGEILESLKSQKIVIPEKIVHEEDDDTTTPKKPKLTVIDQFLYLLKSMEEVLDRKGHEEALQLMGTELENKSMFDSWSAFWGEFLWAGDGSTGTTSANTQDQEDVIGKGVTDMLAKMDPVADTYLAGFSLIIGMVKKIMKVSDDDIELELMRNELGPEGGKIGYDAFLYGTLIQEISLIEDKDVEGTEETSNDDESRTAIIDKKEKHILVRWDLVCQILNHLCTEGYKEKHEPVIEWTYLNPNQRVYTDTPSALGKIDLKNTDGVIPKPLRKYYLDYSVPGRGKLHPLVDDMDLFELLGQSFDPSVCVMPHQFEDSLIVSQYDTTYVDVVLSPNPHDDFDDDDDIDDDQTIIQHPPDGLDNDFDGEIDEEGEENLPPLNLNIEPARQDQLSRANIPELVNLDMEIERVLLDLEVQEYNHTEQDVRNQEENYQPLTSFNDVTFTNRSIGLVYFNLEYLIKTYESMRLEEKDGEKVLKEKFSIMDFVTKIWNDVNEACAGYYNFDIQTEHERPHVVRIVDKTVSGMPPTGIFSFDPQGLNSQVRDFYFSSKIDNDIASTISIAAQAPNNINSLDALSFKSFHKNIKNRFTDNSLSDQKGENEAEAARLELERDIEKYDKMLYNLSWYQRSSNKQYRATWEEGDMGESSTTSNYSAETAKSVAKDIEELIVKINSRYPLKDNDGNPHPKAGQFNVKATNDRNAIIPLEFNLMMDGIAGISPLNLFKINPNKLPYGYQRDDIAFIVKGESQKITAGQDWTIELNGQLTLLNTNQVEEGENAIDPPPPPDDTNKDNADNEDEETNEDWISPFKSGTRGSQHIINSPWPERNSSTAANKKYHTGLDMDCDEGDTLVAPKTGKITQNKFNDGGYGWYIIMELDEEDDTLTHSNGKSAKKILYGHMKSKSPVQIGTTVNQGELIGYCGNTGGSTGPHLHYELGTADAYTATYWGLKSDVVNGTSVSSDGPGGTKKKRIDYALLDPTDTLNA